jgi:O-methyltransferase
MAEANMNVFEVAQAMTQMWAMHHDIVQLLLDDHPMNMEKNHPCDAMFWKLWPNVRHLTLLDRFRAHHLFRYAYDSVISNDGNLIECGTYKGGSGLLLALLLRELSLRRKIYLCDSFLGLPEPNRDADGGRYYWEGLFADCDTAELNSHIHRLQISDYCTVVPGWFDETLPVLTRNDKFCFAHIDCDLYNSTMTCIRHIYPRVAHGAPIVFDDVNDFSGGQKKAINDHIRATREVLHIGPIPQATIIKGLTPGSDVTSNEQTLTIHWMDQLPVSLTHLQKNSIYLSFIRALVNVHTRRLSRLEEFASFLSGERSLPPWSDPEWNYIEICWGRELIRSR